MEQQRDQAGMEIDKEKNVVVYESCHSGSKRIAMLGVAMANAVNWQGGWFVKMEDVLGLPDSFSESTSSNLTLGYSMKIMYHTHISFCNF